MYSFLSGLMFLLHFLLAEETSVLLGITDNRLELKTHKLFSGYHFYLLRLQYT